MSSELDLADLGDVRAWLGFKDATVEHDDALSRLISACSTTMQRLMARTIAVSDYNHYQDGPGSAFMVVRNAPLVRVSAVVVNGYPVPPQYVTFDDTTIYLAGGYRFVRGRNNVQLRYQAGFDEIPADLVQACVETVGLRWRERDRIGQTSKSIGGETVSFSLADFSPSTKVVLASYKRTAPV